MVDINFDALLRIERFISGLDQRLQNQTRLWMDFVAPFTFGEIDDIFDTGGRGLWADLDPIYAARKSQAFPGKGISCVATTPTLKRQQTPNHPGSIAEFGATEMVLGVSGDYFESTFGANYPALHEEGEGDASRPVYELIAAGERFEERISQLGEKYQREEIAILERSF